MRNIKSYFDILKPDYINKSLFENDVWRTLVDRYYVLIFATYLYQEFKYHEGSDNHDKLINLTLLTLRINPHISFIKTCINLFPDFETAKKIINIDPMNLLISEGRFQDIQFDIYGYKGTQKL